MNVYGTSVMGPIIGVGGGSWDGGWGWGQGWGQGIGEWCPVEASCHLGILSCQTEHVHSLGCFSFFSLFSFLLFSSEYTATKLNVALTGSHAFIHTVACGVTLNGICGTAICVTSLRDLRLRQCDYNWRCCTRFVCFMCSLVPPNVFHWMRRLNAFHITGSR